MRSRARQSLPASLACLLVLSACAAGHPGAADGEDPHKVEKPRGSFVRVHYRLPDGGDTAAWGVHFFGAGALSPSWGSPQRFSQTDDFGGYTDIKVTVTSAAEDAWLGLIPVLCQGGGCKKDVETAVRFVDLEKNAHNPDIAECWITQGQAVQIKRPGSTGPAYKIGRPRDFIDLGDGTVRLMFRVAPGSTGTVRHGPRPDALEREVRWSEKDEVNKQGVLLGGLLPGEKVYYKISTVLKTTAGELRDETATLELVPISFTAIADAKDFAEWGRRGVMYQLIVRTFADGGTPVAAADPDKESGIDPARMDGVGDLVGLRMKLPYLKELGADAIWMTPVFRAKSYHGYDTTDFYDIDPSAGTRKDFLDLTQAAHALDMRVILDLVQNHVADVNPWFLAARDEKHPEHAKYRDWFVWSDEYTNMFTDPHPFDASSVMWACKSYRCYHAIFGAAMPELDFRNPEVRAEMKKIAAYWIGLGADGFRLDASKHIDQFDDNNGIALSRHGTHVWWKEFNHHVKKGVVREPGAVPVLLAGENRWDDPGLLGKMVPYAGDMDSQFDFPFRTVLASYLAGNTGEEGDLAGYIERVRAASAAPEDGGNVNHFYQRFLSNHDLDRPATQLAGPMLAERLKQAASVVLTVPGMPVIYYGEELGKRGKRDRYLGTEGWDHDEFIREPMSWFRKLIFRGDRRTAWDIDFTRTNAEGAALMLGAGMCKAPNPDYPFIKFLAEDEAASFEAQKDDPESLYHHYKKLVEIRRANPVITALDARLTVERNDADIYSYRIANLTSSLVVVLNRRPIETTFRREIPARDLLSGAQGRSFQVPPYGTLILQ